MTLKDRHDAALNRAMALSRQFQDLQQQMEEVRQDILKTAGQIDLLAHMLAEASKEGA